MGPICEALLSWFLVNTINSRLAGFCKLMDRHVRGLKLGIVCFCVCSYCVQSTNWQRPGQNPFLFVYSILFYSFVGS